MERQGRPVKRVAGKPGLSLAGQSAGYSAGQSESYSALVFPGEYELKNLPPRPYLTREKNYLPGEHRLPKQTYVPTQASLRGLEAVIVRLESGERIGLRHCPSTATGQTIDSEVITGFPIVVFYLGPKRVGQIIAGYLAENVTDPRTERLYLEVEPSGYVRDCFAVPIHRGKLWYSTPQSSNSNPMAEQESMRKVSRPVIFQHKNAPDKKYAGVYVRSLQHNLDALEGNNCPPNVIFFDHCGVARPANSAMPSMGVGGVAPCIPFGPPPLFHGFLPGSIRNLEKWVTSVPHSPDLLIDKKLGLVRLTKPWNGTINRELEGLKLVGINFRGIQVGHMEPTTCFICGLLVKLFPHFFRLKKGRGLEIGQSINYPLCFTCAHSLSPEVFQEYQPVLQKVYTKAINGRTLPIYKGKVEYDYPMVYPTILPNGDSNKSFILISPGAFTGKTKRKLTIQKTRTDICLPNPLTILITYMIKRGLSDIPTPIVCDFIHYSDQ